MLKWPFIISMNVLSALALIAPAFSPELFFNDGEFWSNSGKIVVTIIMTTYIKFVFIATIDTDEIIRV